MTEKKVSFEKEIMTATAKVGNDVIEDVEYFMLKRFTFPFEIKESKIKMEDFWYTITRPFRRAKLWIKDIFWEIRYGFERMFKGYDSVDVFETYSKFIRRYHKILNEFKNNHYTCPWEIPEDEWNDIIDKMLYHLHYMEEKNVEEELMRDVPDGWTPSGKIVYEIMNKHKDEFFKLFSEYFFNLWD